MENKRLTLNDLINKSTNKDKELKNIEIYIKSMDKTILAKAPDNKLLLDALDTAKDNAHDGDLYLIYNSVIEPNLKDNTLHDAYNVGRPFEIIDKIFTLGEIANIVRLLTKDSGIYDTDGASLVEDIKN